MKTSSIKKKHFGSSGLWDHGQHDGQGKYCDLSTASKVFLIFTTQLYIFECIFIQFALFNDEPEVFLPNCNTSCCPPPEGSKVPPLWLPSPPQSWVFIIRPKLGHLYLVRCTCGINCWHMTITRPRPPVINRPGVTLTGAGACCRLKYAVIVMGVGGYW